MSNAKGMVEVLTEAYFNKFFPQPMPIPEHRARVAEVRELAVYLAANLEAAGFGPVKEAQAEALEEAAADYHQRVVNPDASTRGFLYFLRARAAETRKS